MRASGIESECRVPAECGMNTVIEDSGRKNDDHVLAPGVCGSWRMSRETPAQVGGRRSDFVIRSGLLSRILGNGRRIANVFRGRISGRRPMRACWIPAPRRESVPDRSLQSSDDRCALDGLKRDFIDLFTSGNSDPALSEGMGGAT